MRIGVWGSYKFGNYGDDLMALMVCDEIKAHGREPLVYSMHHRIAESAGVRATSSAEEFFQSVDAIIVGGGALTANYGRESDLDAYHYNEIKKFNDLNVFYGRPTFVMSIGGNGDPDEPVPPEVVKLLGHHAVRGVTVRLRAEQQRLARHGLNVRYYPDVVLRAGKWAGAPDRRGDERVVGINLPMAKGIGLVVAGLGAACRARGYRMRAVVTHHSACAEIAKGYGKKAEMVLDDVLFYREAKEFTRELAKLAIVISYKLHVGVACMSTGGSFLSFGGKGKTGAFMSEHGAAGRAISKWKVYRLWESALLGFNKHVFKPNELARSDIADAQGHLEELRSFLRRLK